MTTLDVPPPGYETVFARILTGDDVERWVIDTLWTWSGTYLAEVERQHNLAAGALQRPRAWLVAPSWDKWPEDQVPAVVVQSVGLAEPASREGRGAYRARWQVGVGCIVSARTQAETHRMAQLYVAAHRALLIQRPSLGGRAEGVVWQDEDYTQLVYDDLRSLGMGAATFSVEVADVTSWGVGPTSPSEPLDPDTAPWPLWPTVQTHEETVEHTPPPEPLPRPDDQEGGADASRS